jgi:large subunit ribosomal protein L20
MPKAKFAVASRKRRKRVLKESKGQFGSRSKLFRIAVEAVRHAKADNYVDRKRKKRDFRRVWIVRLNAALEETGLSYSKFIACLKKGGVEVNRKMLADIAKNDPAGFKAIVEKVR